jgi:hypothetical protein
MSYTEQHKMELEKIHETGAEEWYCPICERRFLMQWPPTYKKIVLEPGNEYAHHYSAKIGPLEQAPQAVELEDPILSEDLRIALDEVLQNLDFGDQE